MIEKVSISVEGFILEDDRLLDIDQNIFNLLDIKTAASRV
jgi:hypothetical protein